MSSDIAQDAVIRQLEIIYEATKRISWSLKEIHPHVPLDMAGGESSSFSNFDHHQSLMLLEYIQAALNHANYEILEEDDSYYGEIPLCQGVYANASSLEACRTELREVLEEWILFRVHRNLSLPEIDGLSLKIEQVA